MNTAEAAWRRRALAFLLAVALSNVAFLCYGYDFIVQGYGDFTSFYAAGKLIQRGDVSRLYDLRVQWEVQQEFASSVRIRRHALPYIRPPFEALLFWPLAYLTYPAACAVWMACKILILFLTFYLIRTCILLPPILSLSPKLLTVLSVAASPVALDLLQGQDAILLLFVFALVSIALIRKNEFTAGMFLAMGLFKFHLVIPFVLVFALRRRARFVWGFTLIATILAAISVALVGWHNILFYPHYLWGLSHSQLLGLPPDTMPNLNGLISSTAGHFGAKGYIDWLAMPIVLGGVALVAYIWHPLNYADEKLTRNGFSLAIATVILTSYYLSGYDIALLILPLLLMGDCLISREISVWVRRLFSTSMCLLLFIPAYWILNISVKRSYWMPITLATLVLAIAHIMNVHRRSIGSITSAVSPHENG